MDGILIINKPKNYTSNDIVNKVKKLLKTKVGHTGTLDPNATGVLPLLLGKGTKFSKYLINHDKKYIATLKLGIKTSTADVEGDILEQKDVSPELLNESSINEILKSMEGKQTQTPPIYSAIKVKGKKLYEYARQNKDVEIPTREICIYSLKLVNINKEENEISFEVECSKGTYIRTLCEDIAEKMGTIGFMKELNRLKVGDFSIDQAISLETLERNKDNENWLKNNMISLEKLLKENKKIYLESKDIKRFFNGIKIHVNEEDGIYSIYLKDEFLGSGEVENNNLKRDVIIKELF